MQFSIITPSYNQAAYLRTCLNSVSRQNYSNVEHIVIDGGSTDGSIEILEEFQTKDNRLQFITEPDKGQGDAVNKGFSKANGDIIAWINSDDYYFNTSVFDHVASLFNTNPDVDIIYGGMAYVDKQDNFVHARIPPKYNYSLLTRIAYIGNTNAFYRRKVIDRHLVDPDYHFVIDHEYMLRITKDFKALCTKRMLACFRVHPAAKTQTLSKQKKDNERKRRDQYHNINVSSLYKILQLRDRALYRISLFYADIKYLPEWKANPPYKIFLE